MTVVAKRGLRYPLQIDGRGGLSLSTDYSLVREHILSVIQTRPYERVMNADYGLPDFIFETLNPELINSRIREAIIREVLELSNLKVTGEWRTNGEEGLYQVTIEYSTNGIPQPPINFSLQQ